MECLLGVNCLCVVRPWCETIKWFNDASWLSSKCYKIWTDWGYMVTLLVQLWVFFFLLSVQPWVLNNGRISLLRVLFSFFFFSRETNPCTDTHTLMRTTQCPFVSLIYILSSNLKRKKKSANQKGCLNSYTHFLHDNVKNLLFFFFFVLTRDSNWHTPSHFTCS